MTEMLFGEEPRFLPRSLIVVLPRATCDRYVAREHAATPVRYRTARLCALIEAELTCERIEPHSAQRAPAAHTVPIRIPHPPPAAQRAPAQPVAITTPHTRRAPDLRRLLFAAWVMGGTFVAIWLTAH